MGGLVVGTPPSSGVLFCRRAPVLFPEVLRPAMDVVSASLVLVLAAVRVPPAASDRDRARSGGAGSAREP